MIEHRLIERMLKSVVEKIPSIKESGKADPVFIDTVVDFVRTYADRTHHGKEEDILFKALVKKKMSDSDRALMLELVEDHKYGRSVVKTIVSAKDEYVAGDVKAIGVLIENLEALAEFYPKHIIKEDKVFFPSTENLFSKEEQDAMLAQFWEFDRNMIHEKYYKVVEDMKASGTK